MRIIDADALKESFGERRLDHDFCIPYDEATARDLIDDAPTIDPVKHGRWEQPEEIDVEEGAFRCNVCGSTFCLIDGTPEENQYFYCPSCGARMDADE